MKRTILCALALALLACPAAWSQRQAGFSKHEVQFTDDLGRPIEVTSLSIYLANSTTNATIYMDRGLTTAITVPLTESSTNTTLADGSCYWYGPDAWEFSVTTDDGRTITSSSAPSLSATVTQIQIPIWYSVVNTATYTDAQNIALGTDGDWVITGGATANRLTFIPAADASTVYFGNGTVSSDVRFFGSSAAIYAQFDESSDGLDLFHYDVVWDDDSDAIFGSDSDWKIESATAKMLDVIPATSDESSAVRIGADTAGADLIVYGTTSGDLFQWDASADYLHMVGDLALFTMAEAGADQFKVDATGAVAGNAIVLETTDGGLQINVDGATNGDIDIDADSKIDIDATDDITITVTSGGAAEDLTIAQVGANDSSIILTAAGTGTDAIKLNATAGGVDIDGGSGADVAITSTGKSVVVTATEAAADAIKLDASTGAGGITLVAGTGGINVTGSIVRTSQQYVQSIAYAKLGTSGAGWVIGAADNVSLATLPASQTAEQMVIPITIPLKVGWTITAFSVNGQIDSAGNAVTLDADLRKHTEATAGYADASIGAITQISKTADYKVVDAKSGLAEVVAADESYYILVTGTTAGTTDIEIASITVTVSEI